VPTGRLLDLRNAKLHLKRRRSGPYLLRLDVRPRLAVPPPSRPRRGRLWAVFPSVAPLGPIDDGLGGYKGLLAARES
jgi:hypothetical protein